MFASEQDVGQASLFSRSPALRVLARDTQRRVTVRLEFDRGTILLTDATASVASILPGMLWDERVRAYRCAARHYPALVELLRAEGVRLTDDVPIPGPCDAVTQPAVRPYQEAALTAWELAGRRGVVVLPTGSGKTRVALAAIARCNVATLCLVPTRVLVEQWRHELSKELGVSCGQYGDGERTKGAITVATFESGWRHMQSLGSQFALIVVDEVHHFGNGLRDEALEMSTAAFRLGLTATPPSGPSAATIEDLVGPTVIELGLRTLAGPYLAPFEVVTLHIELDASEREEYEGHMNRFRSVYAQFRRFQPSGEWRDFARAAARTDDGRRALVSLERARSITALPRAKRAALKLLLERHRTEQKLIFTRDNATAYAVARDSLVAPLTCDIGRAERSAILAHFRAGRLRALVSAQVLNEGLDVPEAEVAIVLGGRRGEREHVQRIGRVLRPRPGKRAVVYELVVRGTREEREAAVRRQGV